MEFLCPDAAALLESLRGSRDIPPARHTMMDAIFIATGCGLFLLAVAYVYACDRL
jgi:hypothetical protein